MVLFGDIILWIIMLGVLIGAAASVIRPEGELGKEFVNGIFTIGPVFLAQAAIMASVPYLSVGIKSLLGGAFDAMGSDVSIASLAIIAVDMGGYQLADKIAQTREAWITASVVGYLAGATIVYLIPVGLTMLPKKDHKYLALGVMAGLIAIPFGVFITMAMVVITHTPIREIITTQGEAAYFLMLSFKQILLYLLPLIIFCLSLAFGLKYFTNAMIAGFLVFGKIMDCAVKMILAFCIIEYFTGIFTKIFGGWGFDPLFAEDGENLFRAIEIAGYIGIMLAGTFPIVYLFHKYCTAPMAWIGKKIGLTEAGAAGFVMVLANIIATYHMAKKMSARDKVLCIAFGVCAQAAIGDHLSFTVNFQPSMVLPILLGKLLGGFFAVFLAIKISVPTANHLEELDKQKAQ